MLPLPMARGEYWASGTSGAAPTKNLGQRYQLDDGTELMLVKNGNGAIVYGTQATAWKNPHVEGVVELTDADNQKNVAGIVDHVYADKGKTVPANALFYVITRGDAVVRCGAAATPGQAIRTDAGASALAEGRVQPPAVGLSNNVVGGAFIGVFLATGVAASVINTGSCKARIFIP